jgi:serine/threonine-protein kinase
MAGSLIGGRLGKYEIHSEIGRGGAGVVYRGHDPDLDRDVAIKVLAPYLVKNEVLVERFRREARLAAQLDHPNIVTIYDVGVDGEWYYIVMRYLEGETLTELIDRRAPLPTGEAYTILHTLAGALDYAHGRSLVHRDIKPANIIISPSGHATITDFGIAKAAFETQLTVTGTIVGTPDYMSPEQIEGGQVDGRSDQYSLSLIAYELLSGQFPYKASGPGNLLYMILHEKTPPIGLMKADLPEEVDEVLGRGLAKRAEERFETVTAFVNALGRALGEKAGKGAARSPQVRPKQPALRGRIPKWVPVLAVGLVLLVMVLVALFWGEEEPGPPEFEMLHVPAGEFVMGSEIGTSYEQPVHTVYLEEFWIDRTEVTNARFAEFATESGYETEAERKGGTLYGPEGRVQTAGADWQHPQGPDSALTGLDEHPVVLVSWFDAVAYCEWRGARLPTEAEWEKAARSDDARTHPWGEMLDGSKLNYCDAQCPFDWREPGEDDGYRFTAPVASYSSGASPYGALDMAGNVREWVADWFSYDTYRTSSQSNPTGPSSGEMRVARGSAWNDIGWTIHVTDRFYYLPSLSGNDIGFRCASSSPP